MDFGVALKRINSRKPKSINSKAEYYAFYNKGMFGNRPLTWENYQELLKSRYEGLVCIRSTISSVNSIYNVLIEQVPEIIKLWEKRGIPSSTVNFNQSMPDNLLKIQGEIWTNPDLYLKYSKIRKPMKQAFETYYKKLDEEKESNNFYSIKLQRISKIKLETGRATGLKAKLMLQEAMSESSYEDLQILLKTFSNSIIEFSSWDCCVGDLEGRNTIFWEVRNY